ncbi:MAG: Y-family DNA polymerase [Cellvibrionaceae bacterium]
MLALVDVNSCYASCEAIFRPDLREQPVVVLTNNDGCIVARNKAAKALGIPDLVPYFKIRHQLQQWGVKVFSSNYTLYGDISQRIMSTLATFTDHIEIYSIDEAFLNCDGFNNLQQHGLLIKQCIWQQQRIGVGVGIAPTKTLAKLANHTAKRLDKTQGVCVLDAPEKWQWVLERVPVENIWGVGRKLKHRLHLLGIYSGADLAACSASRIKKEFSIVLERTVRELNGEACIPLEDAPPPKQQIVCSRSFGCKVLQQADLEQAIVQYTYRAAEKLRSQQSLCNSLQVWMNTSRFDSKPLYQNTTINLPASTDDCRVLCQTARKLVQQLYRPDYRYAKAGVSLLGVVPNNPYQADIFQKSRSPELMQTLDIINKKYGSGCVLLAGQGLQQHWQMARRMLSPAYTTRWRDIPKVQC